MGDRGWFVAIVVVVALAFSGCIQTDEMEYKEPTKVVIGPFPEEHIPREKVELLFADMAGSFTENRGQLADVEVLFYAHGPRASVAFRQGSIQYIPRSTGKAMEIEFVDANRVIPVGEGPLSGVKNYIKGPDPEGWTTDVRTFREVRYTDLWDGIDLKYYIKDRMLKYDLLVSPGSDPASISFSYQGVDGVGIEGDSGDLLIRSGDGTFRIGAPLSFQEMASRTVEVESAFTIQCTSVGYTIGRYDPTLPLVIDPGLEFGTYFGGSSRDVAREFKIDVDGNILVAGNAQSDDIPTTPGVFCETFNANPPLSVSDGFIAKFNHNVTRLLFCTYIGGTLWDTINGVNTDEDGNVYIVGATGSDDFPLTPDAIFDTKRNQTDCYFAQLDPDCAQLLFSTLLGGSTQDDFIYHVEIGHHNNVIIGGTTGSPDFPVTNGTLSDTLNGPNDIYILNISLAEREITWGTFIGGSDVDGDQEMILLDDGSILMAGTSASPDFPVTEGAFCATYNGGFDDVVVFRLSSDGRTIEFATYIGGSSTGSEGCNAMELNDAGEIWICGATHSDDFPTTPDAYAEAVEIQTFVGFFSKFNQNCSELLYSSYMPGLGGCDEMTLSPEDDPVFFMRVGFNYAYPCPTTSWNPDGDGYIDDYIIWMDIDNRSLYNASFIGCTKAGAGGNGNDYVMDIERKDDGTYLLLGMTVGEDFPTSEGAFCRTWSSSEDAFIAGFTMEKTPWDVPPGLLNLTASAGDAEVVLTWSIPKFEGYWPLRGMRIYYGETPSCSDGLIEIPVTTRETVRDLANGRRYYFKVAPFSAVGEGPATETVNATPFGIPSEPLALGAIGEFEEVHLTWLQPANMRGMPVSGYRIHRGTSFDNLTLLTEIANVTDHIDTEIITGETYFYRVQAFHALAAGELSEIVSAKPYGPPTVPQYLQGERGNGSVTLTWLAPDRDGGLPIQSYRVYRGTTPDTLAHVAYVSTGESYQDTNVYNGITYLYAISAVNTAAEGPRTPAVQVTPSGSSFMPRSFSIDEGDGQITLSWDPPDYTGGSPVAAYWVYRGTSPDTLEFHTDAGTNGSFTDTGLANGQTYHYQVLAVTAAGPGDPSPVITALPMAPPGPPEGFTVTAGDKVVDLIWLAPVETGGSPIQFYRVYRGDSPDRLSGLTDVPAGTTRFSDLVVEVGRTYHYAVTAGNLRLEGPFSEVLRVTVTGRPWPPTNLTGEVGDGFVTLAWDPPWNTGGVQLRGYNVLVGDAEDELVLYRYVGLVQGHTVEGLENGRDHWFALQAVNEWGESDPVGPYRFTPIGLPGPPTDLAGTVDRTLVTLEWGPPEEDGGSPVTGYLVYRRTDGGEVQLLAELGTATTYMDIGLERGSSYHYTVVTVTEVGRSDGSREVTADIEALATTEPPEGTPMWMLVVGIAGATLLGLAAVASTEPGRYELTLLSLPLWARLQKEDVMGNRTRYAIIGIITDNPGIHFKAILKEFEIPAGAAVHHLNVLEKERYIFSVRDGRLKRFYLAGTRVPENLRMTPEETREEVLDLVARRPGISQKEVIDELGINRDTAGYHLRELVKAGRLEDGKEGKYTVYRVK